ncbi:MAG TPA: universal stress protein [Candidatus Polarisedimenticolia bacterium]|nr:universal stress protein [Candidatus Polarisedimenticolia bacterium]
MIAVERIGCGIDFSDHSRYALQHAAALARWYSARLFGVHVSEAPLPPADGPRRLPGLGPLRPEARHDLMRTLEGFLSPAAAAAAVQPVLLEGHPARELARWAEELPADLLVLGTHGRHGFERLMLGSVTERIVRRAACPVLTVPLPSRGLPVEGRPPFRTILCPVDFSPPSLAALVFAVSLAEESDAGLILLHVVEWSEEWAREAGAPAPEGEAPAERRARDQLAGLVTEEARTFARPEIVVARGKASGEILRVASEREAEVIVIGVQGRGALDLAVFGSTTNHVVRAAGCPVLTIRAA